MIADETTEKFNTCLIISQEAKEAWQKIEEKLNPFMEFMKVMKEAVKLANFEDKQPQNPLIHEDLEEMKQLIDQFNGAF